PDGREDEQDDQDDGQPGDQRPAVVAPRRRVRPAPATTTARRPPGGARVVRGRSPAVGRGAAVWPGPVVAARPGGRGRRRRRWGERGRDHLFKRLGEQRRGGQRRPAAPLALEQGLGRHFVDGGGHARAYLPGTARPAVGQRGGGQRAHPRTGPVPGQRRV